MLQSVRIDSLQLNQKFTISLNGAPSINVQTFKGAFFGFCYSQTSNSTSRVYPPYALVFPFSKNI